MAHYAWSDIRAGTTDKPVNVARGEEVSKSKLGINDTEWDALVAGGSAREKKFPAPKEFEGSAVDFVRQQLQEATSMSSLDEEEAASELKDISEGSSQERNK